MKKNLFILAAAAVALASCSSDDLISENAAAKGGQPQEIGVMPFNQTVTRSAIAGSTFNDADNFDIVAYLADGGTSTGNYFPSTLFAKDGEVWTGGATPRFWPLSASTLNFLAITNTSGTVSGKITNTFGIDDSKDAQKAKAVLSGNNVYNQADLMYAAGQGKVTQSGNALSYGNNVSLVFQHALAWINFKVKTSTSATGLSIAVNSITLEDAVYDGTYTITNTTGTTGYCGNSYAGGYDVTSSLSAGQWADLVGIWGSLGSAADMKVPNSTHDAAQGTQTLNGTSTAYGDGLLVVPDGKATGFTINYTITQGAVATTYNYTYTFSDIEKNWQQRKKYTYDINITLTEIQVAPSVADWDATTPSTYVDVPTQAFNYSTTPSVTTGTFTLPSATAGTYTVSISGLPADSYKAEVGTGTGTFITAVSPTADTAVAADAAFTVSFTVTSDTGKNQTVLIKNDEGTTLFTLTVVQP